MTEETISIEELESREAEVLDLIINIINISVSS